MTFAPQRILIAGAPTGCWTNAGDEAILAAMAADLRKMAPGVELSVVSSNPEGALARYRIEELPYYDIPRLVEVAQASDLLVLGGGSIFFDYWGFDPGTVLTSRHEGLTFYGGFALLAGLLTKPLMIYGVGVGPLRSELGKAFTRIAFEQAQVATVRDPESRTLLGSLGLDVSRVRVTADPAFSFQAADEARVRRLLEAEVSAPLASPVVGVALRNWDIEVDQAHWEREVVTALDQFIDQYGGTILFLPFHKAVDWPLTDDLGLVERVSGRMRHRTSTVVLGGEYLPEEKAGVLKSCDLVLGMRLHAVIFALKYGVPAVALSYDPKVANVLGWAGCPEYGIDLRRLTSEKLTALLGKAYEHRAQLRAQLKAKLETLADLGLENARLAADLMHGRISRATPPSPMTVDLLKWLEVERAIQLHTLQASLKTRQEEITTQGQTIQALQAEVAGWRQEVNERDQEIARQRRQEAAITGSRGWRLLQLFWRTRQRLLPNESLGHGILRAGVRRVRGPITVPSQPIPEVVAPPPPPSQPSPPPNESVPLQAVEMTPPSPGDLAEYLEAAKQEGSVTPDVYRARPLRLGQARPRVAILTNRLLDWQTREPCFGGGERYCLTLGTLLRRLGFEVTFFQVANAAFEGKYYGFPVIALPPAESYSEFQHGVCDAFYQASADYDHVVYNMANYASGRVREDGVMICHGVWWDHDRFQPPIHFRTREWFAHLYRAFSQPRLVVNVDTNAINFIRALWPEAAARMTYLPNWADTKLFQPPAQRGHHPLTVLFPRRAEIIRGAHLVGPILEQVAHDCRFRWVGEGEETELVKAVARRDRRLEFYAAAFEQMPRFYQEADICVIPTVASEGTSLSCLEGLASGCAVVATAVGGLPELIQPGVNGLLVDPAAGPLAAAINRLIEEPEERARFQQAALQTAEHFSLEVWEGRWASLLQQLGWLSHPALLKSAAEAVSQ